MNEQLSQLRDSMPGSSTSERTAKLAVELNRLAGRRWTSNYLSSVIGGSVPLTKPMRAAAERLSARVDGVPDYLATAVARSVYSDPDNDLSGAFVIARARLCERCGTRFVPNAAQRRFCTSCRPQRPKAD